MRFIYSFINMVNSSYITRKSYFTNNSCVRVKNNIPYTETTEFNEDVISSADIIYMTRVQRERFSDLMEYEKVKNCYRLTNSMLQGSKKNLRILHPLPRVTEIAHDVDNNPKAYYFQQAQNGLYVREALICDVLGINV